MKRITFVIVACLTFAAAAFAQDEKLEPGIYAVIDGNATPLSYANGIAGNTGLNVVGVEIGKVKFSYKGETSGVRAVDKLIMVINPESKNIRRTPKLYDPFIKTMTPEFIMIIPLEVAKNKRIYDEGTSVQGINTQKHERVEFQWELVDENTYEITADFQPGEYAIVFKPTNLGKYDFSGIYGFYVSEGE
ncbi:MAG: hypothetical protein MJY45_06520 [Bacteroidales bacterium]|nr:hypothetical protein [Bacteroidales bacterium]